MKVPKLTPKSVVNVVKAGWLGTSKIGSKKRFSFQCFAIRTPDLPTNQKSVLSLLTNQSPALPVTNLSWDLLRNLPGHLDRDLGAVLLGDIHTMLPRDLDWLLEGNLLAGVVRHLFALLVRHLDQSEINKN